MKRTTLKLKIKHRALKSQGIRADLSSFAYMHGIKSCSANLSKSLPVPLSHSKHGTESGWDPQDPGLTHYRTDTR